VVEQRPLVRQQPVVAAVQLVDLGQPRVLAQKVGQGAALEPLAVQAPLAARRQQPVGRQHEQDPIPARALAAPRQPLGPEAIQLKLAPQRQRQPARPPLPRPAQPHRRQLEADDRSIRQQPFAAILGKQRQRPRPLGAVLEDVDRAPPGQLLRAVDLAKVQHMPLHHAPAADAPVLDHAPVAMRLAVLVANLGAQEHSGRQVSAKSPPWE